METGEAVRSGSVTLESERAPGPSGRVSRERLVLFFTRGMSLEGWERAGMLGRELALYQALRSHMEDVAFLTYGPEQTAQGIVGPIAILPNRWRIHSTLYSVIAPLLYARTLWRATIFKTNQLNGAWTAVIAKRLFRKPLLVRCGYLLTRPADRIAGGPWAQHRARWIEGAVCRAADRIIVVTEADRRHLMELHRIEPMKIRVIPNAIDTERFRPMPEIAKEAGRLIVVGRLSAEKRPGLLFDAIRRLDGVRLSVVGDGPLREALARRAREERLPVEFLGMVSNEQLPRLLNRAEAFVLPSQYEGHPKGLLEAMACGLPVIGTAVPGIQEAITHRVTGYLCAPSAGALRAGIAEVLADAALRQEMGRQARRAVETACALPAVVEQECALLDELCAERDRRNG